MYFPTICIVLFTNFITLTFSTKLYNLDIPEYRTQLRLKQEYNLLNHQKVVSSVNLTKFLDPLVQQRCLILADNFVKVDIRPYQYPILLRHYSLGALVPKGKKSTMIWIESQTLKLNGSTFPCTQSKYKAGIVDWTDKLQDGIPDYCVTLNQTVFASHSKPWNCQVHTSLYYTKKETYLPPPFYFNPRIFSCCTDRSTFLYLLPSSVPTLNSFFTDAHNDFIGNQYFIRNKIVKRVSISSNYMQYMIASHELVVLIKTKLQFCKFTGGEYKTLSAAIYCIACVTKELDFTFGKKEIQLIQLSNLNNLAENGGGFPKLGEHTWWKINSVVKKSDGQPNENIVKFLTKCDLAKKPENSLEMLDYEFAKEWVWMLSNHTYSSESWSLPNDYFDRDPWDCYNGKRSRPSSPYIVKSEMTFVPMLLGRKNMRTAFPVFMKANLRSLRFVSCSTSVMSHLPFEEFTNIFQKDVWAVLLLTLIVLTILPTFFGRPSVTNVSTYLRNFELQIRIILGQDVPVSAQFMLKTISLLTCLTSIILGNAYKYDNVYRMIAPRNKKPFTNFSELAENGFTTYTRLGTVILGTDGIEDMCTKKNYFKRSPHVIVVCTFRSNDVQDKLEKFLGV